jgi:hypothetical protein
VLCVSTNYGLSSPITEIRRDKEKGVVRECPCGSDCAGGSRSGMRGGIEDDGKQHPYV